MSDVKELMSEMKDGMPELTEAKRLSNEGLLARLRECVSQERKLTLQILKLINEATKRRLYAELGYPSLFEWLVKDLGYSESAAMRRINSARMLTIDKSIGEKVTSGELNITNLAKVQSAIRAEEKRTGETLSPLAKMEVVELVTAKSSREAEVALASRFPESVLKKESVRPVSSEEYRVQVVLTQAQMKKLERVREIASHTHCGAGLAEVIELLADQYLKRKDPLQRQVKPRGARVSAARNAIRMATRTDTPAAAPTAGSGSELDGRLTSKLGNKLKDKMINKLAGKQINKLDSKQRSCCTRKPLQPSLRNLVYRRAQGQCEYRDPKTKRRCESRYLAEIDHRLPVARGGGNEPENLRVLCRAHNALMAERLFGVSHKGFA